MNRASFKYKTVSQKWVKVIPSHWRMERLKLIFGLRKEQNNPIITDNILSLTAKQGVVPYAEKEGVGGNKPKSDLTKYNICREGDLLVNNMNVVSGAAGVSRYTGCISPVYYPLVLRHNDNVWYYHYIFRLVSFQRSLIGLGKGILMHENDNGTLTSVRMRISMDYLGNVLLPVPPRDEQDQIVRFLDWKVSEINKFIAIRRKEIQELRNLKNAIVSHFVIKGLNKYAEMKYSGVNWLGDVPESWRIVKLRQILHSVSEKNHPELPLLSVVREKGVIVRDVDDIESNHNYIPDDLSNYKVVRENHFVINKMKSWQGSYGVSSYTGIVSPAYFIFDIDFPNLEYFQYAIRSKSYVNFFAQASDGIRVGQWDLQMDKMKEIPFLIPPEEEQREIVSAIKRIQPKCDSQIDNIQRGITILHELKNKIISDVVTGKLDVRNITIPEYEHVDDIADEYSEADNNEEEDESTMEEE